MEGSSHPVSPPTRPVCCKISPPESVCSMVLEMLFGKKRLNTGGMTIKTTIRLLIVDRPQNNTAIRSSMLPFAECFFFGVPSSHMELVRDKFLAC